MQQTELTSAQLGDTGMEITRIGRSCAMMLRPPGRRPGLVTP